MQVIENAILISQQKEKPSLARAAAAHVFDEKGQLKGAVRISAREHAVVLASLRAEKRVHTAHRNPLDGSEVRWIIDVLDTYRYGQSGLAIRIVHEQVAHFRWTECDHDFVDAGVPARGGVKTMFCRHCKKPLEAAAAEPAEA